MGLTGTSPTKAKTLKWFQQRRIKFGINGSVILGYFLHDVDLHFGAMGQAS
jgi:hypothetical protein